MKWFSKALTAMRHVARAPFLARLLKRTVRLSQGSRRLPRFSVVTAPVMWIARAARGRSRSDDADKDGNHQPVVDHHAGAHPAPNDFYGDIALWMATIFAFAITGNAYWLIVRNSYGLPVALVCAAVDDGAEMA
jgi:hypothetical protein